jgi:regulation of enolase protein 1 (concanavalin A-like superfamily)
MSRAAFALLLGAAATAGAAPVPKDDEVARVWRLYGTPHDPDKGTEFKPDRGTLHVIVPAEHRRLDAVNRTANAPRVWRDVRGDFTAVVRVSFPIRAEVPPKHLNRVSGFASGGLVVWVDDENFLTVTRAESDFNNKPGERFHGEFRAAGNVRTVTERTESKQSAYLRVQRKGKVFEGSYSSDGKTWEILDSHEAAWPEVLKVGVVAENNYKAPFEVVFSEYTITKPE